MVISLMPMQYAAIFKAVKGYFLNENSSICLIFAPRLELWVQIRTDSRDDYPQSLS